MTTPWVIHIGYQKAGSTWLQQSLFPHLKDIHFLGKTRPDNKIEPWARDLFNAMVHQSCFDFSPEKLRQQIQENTPSDLTNVLSLESLVGNHWKGSLDAQRNAGRIQSLWPQAKIMICIRNQIDALESFYKQYLLLGGTSNPQSLFSERSLQTDFRLDHLQYLPLIQHYRNLFGSQQVCVLPFEILKEDPQSFADFICDFIDCPRLPLDDEKRGYVRQGYSPNFCHYVRWANHFTQSPFHPAGWWRRPQADQPKWRLALNPYVWAQHFSALDEKWGTKRFVLPNDYKEALKPLFKKGNQALLKSVPFDLASLGYPV